MIRVLLRLVALFVPPAARPRWREEWLAEMNHARSRGQRLPRTNAAWPRGSIPDALATRRMAATARAPTAGPRAGLFHAVDQDLRYAIRGLAASSPASRSA